MYKGESLLLLQIHQLSEDKIDSLNDLLNTSTSRISMYDRVQKIQPSKVKCEVLELVNIENCDPKKIQVS